MAAIEKLESEGGKPKDGKSGKKPMKKAKAKGKPKKKVLAKPKPRTKK